MVILVFTLPIVENGCLHVNGPLSLANAGTGGLFIPSVVANFYSQVLDSFDIF